MNVYYNFYYVESEDRTNELNYCLLQLLNNKYINNVFIIINNEDLKHFNFINDKLKIIEINYSRPTFKSMIDIINQTTSNDDINIMINSDCYLEESSTDFINNINYNEMWCLNKYEIIDDKFNTEFYSYMGSQDCWVFKGVLENIQGIDFYFGIPGCDNRFAYESKKSGYQLRNPSRIVKVIHYHLSGIRSCPYSEWEERQLKGDYQFISPE